MKLTITILCVFSFSGLISQQYSNPQTQNIERYHYKEFNNIYFRAKKLINVYNRKKDKAKASKKEITIMAYKINEALGYMNLQAFKQDCQKREMRLRIISIKNSCKNYGLYITPRLVNTEYNTLYGETMYAKYHQGQKKPENWTKKKSKQVNTLSNTYVTTGYSFYKTSEVVSSK
jgi:hypothetical protein